MGEDLVPLQPILLTFSQGPPEEVSGIGGEGGIDDEWFILDILDEFIDGASSPGRLMMKQLIEDESNCPNIAFAAIGFSLEQLQRHVQRRPHSRLILHLTRRILLRKPKISNLHLSS